jgi:hypothetical protein
MVVINFSVIAVYLSKNTIYIGFYREGRKAREEVQKGFSHLPLRAVQG